MVEANDFDVYESDGGYVAITNGVRRTILVALAKRERELNELVKITGKAKPTLSNLHMRELLAQKLIEERPHPTDARRKIYRLVGKRIGTSTIPIDQLRGAVKQYATARPIEHGLPFRKLFEVFLAGGARSKDVLERQGARLGELSSSLFPATEERQLLPSVTSYWEREGVARTVRIDLELLSLELDVDKHLAETKESVKLVAALLAGFLQGVLGRVLPDVLTRGEPIGGQRIRVAVVR